MSGSRSLQATSLWAPGPAAPRLLKHEVHIWRVPLDTAEGVVQRYANVLSPGERARAEDCPLDQQRAHFVVAHGAVRALLAKYTGQAATDIRLTCSPRGRPFLADQPRGRDEIDFNLTHSGGLALIALARTGRVGVDLEKIRSDIDHASMAKRFLGPGEDALIESLPEHAGRRAFYTRWTRREAYAKAADIPIPRVLDDTDSVRLPVSVGCWKLHDLPVGQDYCGTVATDGTRTSMRCWTLEQK